MPLDDVIKYHVECEHHYRKNWLLEEHMAIHYGYWDDQSNDLGRALDKMNQVLAEKAGIQPSHLVLDAGCGVGGSAIYLAKHYGCKVVGINIVDRQITLAQQFAKKYNVDSLVNFENQDYTNTRFKDKTFDVVWACESSCHSDDKEKFLRESFRLLKKGGVFILCDFFKKKNIIHPQDQYLVDQFAYGLAAPDFACLEDFTSMMKSIGFQNTKTIDITANIISSAKNLHAKFYLGILVESFHRLRGKSTERRMANVWMAFYQYKALKKGLWHYDIVRAEKHG